MNKLFHVLVLSFILCCNPISGFSQTRPKTDVQLAHEDKGELASFLPSKKGLFRGRVFKVLSEEEKSEELHWFVQILDHNRHPVNFAQVSLNAYRKGKKQVKLKYMAPVFAMCADGKYIIGFIEPDQHGRWKLDLEIDHYGKKDALSLEMNIDP